MKTFEPYCLLYAHLSRVDVHSFYFAYRLVSRPLLGAVMRALFPVTVVKVRITFQKAELILHVDGFALSFPSAPALAWSRQILHSSRTLQMLEGLSLALLLGYHPEPRLPHALDAERLQGASLIRIDHWAVLAIVHARWHTLIRHAALLAAQVSLLLVGGDVALSPQFVCVLARQSLWLVLVLMI